MSNERYWYRKPGIIIPAIIAILAAIIGGLISTSPKLPTTPMFIEIDGDTDADGDYVISWESSKRANYYILEEDRGHLFTSPRTLYNRSETKKHICGKSDGDYYYRVKACNNAGESEWSSTRKITVKTTIWEIGINDGSYGEFDQLVSVYPGPFPWHYYVGEPSNRFPKEINDFARTPINIHFSLTDEQSKNDLLLTLDTHSVHGTDFSVRIKTQINDIDTRTFDNKKKTHEINIKKDLVATGENTIILESASPPKTNRWLFWDYLSLKVE